MRTLVRIMSVASKTDHNRGRGARPRGHACQKGQGSGQGTRRSVRSTGEAPRHTPSTSGRRPPDDETFGVWGGEVVPWTEAVVGLIIDYGSRRRQEPRSIALCIRGGSGEPRAASGTGRVRAANPERPARRRSRAVKVNVRDAGEGVQDVCTYIRVGDAARK